MATITGSKRLLTISADAMAAENTLTLGGLGVATQTWVNTQIANLVDSAPATLDTLNELAAALGDDPNFATTITTSISTKLDASVNPIKNASVSNDTITFTRADNTTFNITTSDANTNYYLDGLSFDTGTGVLTASVNGATNKTVDLDGRYLTSFDITTQTDPKYLRSNAADTATGLITFSGGITGFTNTAGISGNNYNITGVNQLTINDPGEGIVFSGTTNLTLAVIDDASDNILNLAGTNAKLQVNGTDVLTAHPSISAATSVNNSGRTYIQDITLDANGHVTGIASAAETVTDTTYTLTVGANGGNGSNINLNPSSGGTNTIRLEGGSNVTITENTSTGVIEIASTDTNTDTTYLAGSGIDLTGITFSHTDTSSQSSVNNSNGTVIQDVTLDTYGHVTSLGSVNLDGRYYTESEINTGNITTSGTWTFNGVVNGLYHSVEEDHYYFDDYNGRRNVNAFLKTQYSDIIKFREVADLEYWNGSAWVDGSSQLNNLKNLLDGRKDTNWYVDSTYYKFRFSVTASSSWPTMALIGIESSWTGSSFPGFEMIIEEQQADSSWSTIVTADFASSNGVTNWGTMFKADSALHTGRGGQSLSTRITIDFYGWTPSNSSYVTIPLQNIFIYSNFSGIANNDYHNLINYDRHVTVPNKLFITTTDTNTSSTTALVLNGTEVEKRTLGSNAFNSTQIPTVNNATLTVQGTGALGGSGTFTANASSNATISITHDDTSTLSGLYGGNNNGVVIEDITVDGYGHVTAIGTRDLDSRFDNYGSWTISDTVNSESISSGDTVNVIGGGATSVSYDVASNTLEISSTDTNTNTNYYLTGLSYNSGTSVLTATVNGATNPTVDLTDKIYADALAVTGNGTTSQYLRSDGDGTFTWATPPDTNTDTNYYLSGLSYTSSSSVLTATVTGGTNQTLDLTNKIYADALAVTGNGTSGQFLRSDGDGTFTWATPTDTDTNTTYTLTVGSGTSNAANINLNPNTGGTNTVKIAGGTNVQVTEDTSTGVIEIAATDTNTTYSAGAGLILNSPTVFEIDYSNNPTAIMGSNVPTGTAAPSSEILLNDSGGSFKQPINTIGLSNFFNDIGAGSSTGDITSVRLSGDSGYAQVNSGAAIFDVVGGTGITTSGSGTTLTITNTVTDTTYSAGSGLELSGTTFSVDVVDSTTQTTIANARTTTSGRTYAIQFDASGNLVVNVPWVDTNTNTTYTADGNYGMTLSGTAFRLENDRRRNSSSTDIYTGNTHDYTHYDASHGIRWYTAGSQDMFLTDAGVLHVDSDVIAYSSTISDQSFKDDVVTIENAIDKVKKLRGVEYTWNAGSRKGKKDLGLIAQEVEEVLPEIVHEHEMPLMEDAEAGKTYKTVDYEKMVGVLIEAVKEQQTQIDSLKAQIEQLKSK